MNCPVAGQGQFKGKKVCEVIPETELQEYDLLLKMARR